MQFELDAVLLQREREREREIIQSQLTVGMSEKVVYI
jgi:hypothetical protein